MNAFAAGQKVEQRSMAILAPFIQARAYDGRYVLTSKGRLARELQRSVGDALMNTDAETVVAVEVKAEERNTHGNLFLETWSNLSRFTHGWLHTLNTDLLLYHFIEDDELWVANYPRLRTWAFRERRIYVYPEREQGKYDQLNDTWGRCVPIPILVRDIGMRLFRPSTGAEIDPRKERQPDMFSSASSGNHRQGAVMTAATVGLSHSGKPGPRDARVADGA